MNRKLSCLLIGAALVLPAAAWAHFVPPPPQQQTAMELLAQFEEHGYASPLQAFEALHAVPAPGPTAPLDLRWRYQNALANFAIRLEDKPATELARAALQNMVDHEHCTPCATALMIRHEQFVERARDFASLRASLTQIEHAPVPPDAQLRFESYAAQSTGHDLLAEYDRAIEAAVKAGETADKAEMPAGRAVSLNMLASSNSGRRDLDRSVALAREGYKLAEQIGFSFLSLQLRTIEGYSLATLKETTQRRVVLLDVLRLSRSAPGLENYERTTLINLSAYSNDTHDYRAAVQYATEAEQASLHSSDPNDRAFALANRGAALAHLGEREAGLAQLREGIAIAEKTGVKLEVVDLLQLLVDTCDYLGRPQQALDTLRRIVLLNEELTSAQRDAAVLQLQEKFSAEQQAREIERLHLENERTAAELETRSLQQRLWVAVSVAVGLAALMLAQWLGKARMRSRSLELANVALSEQTLHDPMTGAFNRRHCELAMSTWTREFAGRTDDKAVVSLVLVDVDRFKHINDRFGHAAGDDVLIEIARRLRTLVRDADAVVRWGGEEFVLLLPGTQRDGLPIVADRVLRAIADEAVTLRDDERIDVHVSAGCVTWPAWPGQTWEQALEIADRALYVSKEAGRNRATCLVGVAPEVDIEALAPELLNAAARGQVTLQTVIGPSAANVESLMAFLGHARGSVDREAA